MIDACSLINIPSHGPKFTWSNNRRRGNVAAALDKGFCNKAWLNHFQDCAESVLQRDFSDHYPMLVVSEACPKPGNYPFRMHKFWTENSSFIHLIRDSWSQYVSGPPFILAHKLKRLKPIIRAWARQSFPNFDMELDKSKEALAGIQSQIEISGMTDDLFGKEADAKTAYLNALKNHEKLWAEKSCITWLKHGDRNSKFFHLYVKIRRGRNTIRLLQKSDGSNIFDRDGIASYMVDCFQSFHKSFPVSDHSDLLNSIPALVDEVDLLSLDAIPSAIEIKRAVWDLDPDSSPGPDGYPGYFFWHFWEVVECDFTKAVLCSSKISILFNGGPMGYFNVERGLRQGDPMSPILFILAEEVLCRGMQALIRDGKIKPLQGPRGEVMLVHLLFADDIFIFMNASFKYVGNLNIFLRKYQDFSGQQINLDKSKLFMRKIRHARIRDIAEVLGISVCNFPTKYLGVQIFKGRVKKSFLLPVLDKVKEHMVGWKGKLLSMAGRVQLVRLVINGKVDA
ncbi:uncharacterized protein LOC122056914 [Macadamia integrifolia]|uniref:uncharacterized protein LOC122056914 n=1 Tax=Macadamia integrifolia TaxID=60698 RepID=UPI001C527B0E|nr:uncharacterized protein LOC122056914 [Macadamia integrifolia]